VGMIGSRQAAGEEICGRSTGLWIGYCAYTGLVPGVEPELSNETQLLER
jgi:hypothetical protein